MDRAIQAAGYGGAAAAAAIDGGGVLAVVGGYATVAGRHWVRY